MKKFILFMFLLLLTGGRAFTQVCTDYSNKQQEIQALKKKFTKNTTVDLRDNIVAQSKIAADLLEKCLKTQNNPTDKNKLMINYQIGKYYFDGGDCTNTQKYFNICLGLTNCSTEKFNQTNFSYKDIILREFHNQYCTNKIAENTSGSKIIRFIKSEYHGKSLFEHPDKDEGTDALAELGTLENIPYLGDEVDSLQKHVFAIADSTAAVKYFNGLTGWQVDITLMSPFLIINVNGTTDSDQMENSQNFLQNNGNKFVSGNVKTEQKLIKNALAEPYFADYHSDNLIPIFLFNGPYDNKHYKDFLKFCNKIHFRYPGKRIGYWNPYDNSVVAWASSGYGTFAHELNHELLHNVFSDIPQWLDEGIASLYEEMNGGPADNWRLVYIKKFKNKYSGYLDINSIVNDYNPENGPLNLLHDCFARYICMYLYSKKLLPDFYRQVKEAGATNYQKQLDILVGITKTQDVATFQKDFFDWLNYRNPPYSWSIQSYTDQVGKDVDAMTVDQGLIAPWH
ncbi:MAG: hypothetical protein V4577_09515 [Bacteroidota bacterium]